jgi:hypothetical protein
MEDECYFVCSRGILKSCVFHSENPKSSCNNDFTYLKNMLESTNMKNGMSIYVCSDLLKFFVNNILPKIKHTFVLVSGDSDLCVPREILTQNETFKLLNSPYLLKWFAQNTKFTVNNKIVQMPIGIDYHTISSNPQHPWKISSENHLPESQENILIKLINTSSPFYERIPKIYITYTTINDRFNQRKYSLQIIPAELMIKKNKFTSRTEVWKEMINYTFILSPAGVGLDCHRTWEALCLGCIPIVCIPEFTNMFEDLPVLVVNNWKELTKELLQQTIELFKTKQFNYEKLKLSYWKNMIGKI